MQREKGYYWVKKSVSGAGWTVAFYDEKLKCFFLIEDDYPYDDYHLSEIDERKIENELGGDDLY